MSGHKSAYYHALIQGLNISEHYGVDGISRKFGGFVRRGEMNYETLGDINI